MPTVISGSDISTGSASVPGGIKGTPAFRAQTVGTQALTSGNWAKVTTLTSETFDTTNAFDSSASSRFQPTVAGYYQINGCAYVGGSALTIVGAALAKNGVLLDQTYMTPTASGAAMPVSDVVYLNGTTDYIELQAYGQGTSPYVVAGYTYISGFLVRAA